jgi:glutamine---fructose-6-phosphate transaminase (isomerizing)
MADKNGFQHFMLKEVFEQPKALRDTIASRVSLDPVAVRIAEEVRIPLNELRELRRINIVASGTSRHAGIVGQHIFQELVRLPAEVDYASEFENRNPLIGRAELTVVITQSGETADTTAAQREKGIADHRDLQRCELNHCARGRRRSLHQRRAGNQHSLH